MNLLSEKTDILVSCFIILPDQERRLYMYQGGTSNQPANSSSNHPNPVKPSHRIERKKEKNNNKKECVK